MATGRTQRVATVGVVEHGNSAVLVTVAPGGELLDRRRIDLTDRGLPTHPHHHEGSWAVGRYLNTPGARRLSLADAVALVERVRAAAARGARDGLEALAAAVPVPIARIALRACPTLPPFPVELNQRRLQRRSQFVVRDVVRRRRHGYPRACVLERPTTRPGPACARAVPQLFASDLPGLHVVRQRRLFDRVRDLDQFVGRFARDPAVFNAGLYVVRQFQQLTGAHDRRMRNPQPRRDRADRQSLRVH